MIGEEDGEGTGEGAGEGAGEIEGIKKEVRAGEEENA